MTDGWRPTSADATDASLADWRKGRSAAAPVRRGGRWRVGLAWGTFLAVCAGFIWLSTWIRPPQPGRLVLLGAGYDTNLLVADNALGLGGLKQLAAYAEKAPLLKLPADGLVELRSEVRWEQTLERLKQPMLMVAISAHGGQDARGPYLLPQDTDLRDNPRHRIRIDDILNELAKLPVSQKKFLVLDAVFMPSHAALGMLHNDFARGLADLDARIRAIPNLVVLCSTSPDELSWPSTDWGSTAFGHFLIEALRGDADADGDHRIDAREIWQFTRKNVSNWARINRFAEQTPMLLPSGPEGERRAGHILVSLYDRKYEPSLPEEKPELPSSLKSTWEKWTALQDMTPAPGVYNPTRWQKYQAGVLRVESLMRAGDADGAQRMQADLDRWDKELRQEAELPAPSLRQTWAIVKSEAEATIDEALEKSFQKIWDAPTDEDAQKAWDDWLKEGQKNPALAPPRRELARVVLDRVTLEPKDIDKAGRMLRMIRDGATPYPPEPHFALMFSRDGPANPPAADFATTLPFALQVRRMAERTPLAADPKEYSYSERLDPWIGAAWLDADSKREKGQDQLLSGAAKDWKEGHAWLTNAENAYARLQTDAALVRKAFAVRDRVQAQLPFYRTWAMHKVALDPDLDKAILEIDDGCHELDAKLSSKAPADVDDLAKKAAELAKKWDALEASHRKHAQQLRAARTVEFDVARTVWRDTEAVLAVPFADRLDLVNRQARISRMILLEGKVLEPPPLPATAAQTAKAWSKRFGEFTLARLGPAWFDRWTKPGAEPHSQVSRRVEVFGGEQKWWESASAAGEQIGQRFVRMNDEIRRLTTLDPKATLAESRAALQEADRIVRLADAQTPPAPGKLGPAAMYRYWLTADLLDRQSRRTWQDHWFDDNPAAEPYFRTVCRGYQLDTQSLVTALGSPNAWKQSLKEWDQKLQAPGELALIDVTGLKADAAGRLVTGGERFAVLTSETALEREYRLQPSRADDPTPGGFPVLWVETYQGLTPLEPRERQRIVMLVDPARTKLEEATPLVCKFTSPLVQQAEEKNTLSPVQRTSLVFKGLFRGQQIRQETRVEVQPTADIIVRQLPLPNKASVAVRTRRDTYSKVGSAQGAVAFVLDASGSMRPTDPAFPEKSRYAQAVSALTAVLRKLPKDTQVSVWTFGQAMGFEKTVDKAEESIMPILAPTLWDSQDPKQLNSLLARLNYPAVEPWNESPIARSLLKAKSDLAGIGGYKTIITITDGGDNRFDKDMILKSRSKNLTQFFRDEFDKGDIALNFVVFPPLTPDEIKAHKELRSTETLAPAGNVYAIGEINKLIEALESLLKQRLNYYVDYQGKNVTVDGTPERGLDVSPAGANYRWFGKGMAPGGHKLRVDVAGRLEKNILLHPGDLLLAALVDTPGGYAFERFLFSSEFPWKRSLENGKRDWKMTVLQNQLSARKDLEMLVSLEKTVDRRESLLEQIKPRDVWVEVSPSADQGPAPPLRWSYLAGYPAPAWAVQAPAWPEGTPPKVQMWWNPDEEARSAADLVLGDVSQDRDRPVFLPGEPPLALESVRFEQHFVEVQPGVLAPKMCLVVRLRHAPGRPVIARLQGFTPAGSEQRLYTQNDKTASLFWFEPDVDPQTRNAELAASRLRLISIAAFKEEARRRDYWLEIRDLSAPDPADERPRPPLELK